MEILKIKQKENGYLINDSMLVPISDKNSDYQRVVKWIESGGVVEPEFTTSELISKLTQKIKSEAATRISSAYPEWQQTNYMAAVTEINNKEIAAMKTIPFVAQYQLTAEELQTLKDADACKKFITAIRVKSNSLERSLDAMTSAELKAFDPARDSHWQ